MKILLVVIIAAVGVASLTIGLNITVASADLSDAEVTTKITTYLQNPINLNWLKDQLGIEDIKDGDYVTKAEFEVYKKTVASAIAHPHTEFSSIASSLNVVKSDITTMKNDIRDLEKGGTSSSSSSSGDFDLMSCLDYNCVDEEDRFNQGDTLYVTGHNNSNDRSLSYKVYDPDNVRIDTGSVSMVPNSPFIFTYQIENNAEDGTYKIVVEIDRDEDEINFIVD